MRLLVVAALSLVAAGGGAGSAGAAALQGDQEIAALNGQRSMNGIPGDITEVLGWSAGCAAHMAYVKANGNVLRHDETPGNPGYTEEGATAGGSSVLSGSGSSFQADGSNDFQHAPIHLMQMLSPFLKSSGAADGCLQTLRDINRPFATDTTFSYPGDNGVALASETAYEGPFVPGDFVGLPMGTTTGQHLYFYAARANAGWYGSVGKILSATLTRNGPGGGPVQVRTVDNSTTGPGGSTVAGQNLGQYLSPGGIVIPVAPLVAGASYTATVGFRFSSDNVTAPGLPSISRTWSFTAANALPLPTVPGPSRPPLSAITATVPTPTPVATPAPAATPTPVVAVPPVDATPVTLTGVKLKKHSLAVKASRDASMWVTIEQKKVTGKGKKRKTKWVFREALSVAVKANAVTTVTHKKLSKGEYRITFRRGGAKGVVQLTKTTKVK